MKFSEEQVKEIVSLKESLIEQIDRHQESMEMLEKNVTVLDLFLKDSSFTKASQLETKKVVSQDDSKTVVNQDDSKTVVNQDDSKNEVKPEENSIPIKRGNDGKIIANAYITPEQVSIILDNEIIINADTPPFKSFFLDRIIGEMKERFHRS